MIGRWLFGMLAALLLLPVAVPLGGVGMAQAASFDCTKAKTPFAKAVCGDPDLSKADDALAAAFAAAQQGLSPDAKAAVAKGQDGWVAYANRACTDDAKPATKPYDADGISCLSGLFTQRTDQLGQGKTIGVYRVYYLDSFGVLRDPDPLGCCSKVAQKTVSVPRLDSTDTFAGAFNRFVATRLKADIDPNMALHPRDGSTDDWDALTVTSISPLRVGMQLTKDMFGHGAAHPVGSVTYIHYLPQKNRVLVAGDVFKGKAWQAHLQGLALTAVKAKLGDALLLDDPKSINPLVIDPARWDFSKDGLIVQFEVYEVAPYVQGPVDVTIPWSALQGDLAKGAEALGG